MNSLYFFLFEFGAILMFLLILRRERKNRQLLETLALVFFYGLLLEIINTHLSQAYFYSKDFLFQVYGIPLAIAAGWGVVYYYTQKLAQIYQLKWYEMPFFMAFAAVVFDLILDPIAVRLGFWTWPIAFNQEWFGVPYDNFVGWVAVVWTFAFLINLSEHKFFSENISRMIKYAAVIISPILADLQINIFVVLSAIFSGRFSFAQIMAFYQNHDFSYAYALGVQSWKFYFFVLIFSALAVYSVRIIIMGRRNIH